MELLLTEKWHLSLELQVWDIYILTGCSNKDAYYVKIDGMLLFSGQDGSYLAEFLLDKGYTVHGIIRRSSSFNTGRISHLYDDPKSHRQV